jgi:Plasmid pRiA4b ORF-3-like protein
MGDNWRHYITLGGRTPATDYFECLKGTGHGVAEEVGGTWGWNNLKAAYRTTKPNKEQEEKMHWFENHASNADPLGLGDGREHEWSQEDVNLQLKDIAVRYA